MTWPAIRDALVTALVVVLSMFLADGADIFALEPTDYRLYLAAGLAAIIRTVLTYLDPKQTAYGRGANGDDH